MKIRALVHAATAAAMVMMASGPAHAMDNRAFNINFHTDATLSNRVGFARATCQPDPVAVMQWGTSTPHQEIIYVGECIDGELVWYPE